MRLVAVDRRGEGVEIGLVAGLADLGAGGLRGGILHRGGAQRDDQGQRTVHPAKRLFHVLSLSETARTLVAYQKRRSTAIERKGSTSKVEWVMTARDLVPGFPFDTAALAEHISRQWDSDIVLQLIDYIRLPAKSPNFDPQWEANGHIEAAVR